MPRVPLYNGDNSSAVQPGNLPGFNVIDPGAPESQALGQAVDQAQRVFSDFKQRADLAAVQEAQTGMTDASMQWMQEAQQQKGKNAFDLEEKAREFYNEQFTQRLNNLASPDQRDAFMRVQAQQRPAFMRQVSGYVNREINQYEEQTYEASINTASNAAIQSYDDQEAVGNQLQFIAGSIRARGQAMGWSDEVINNEVTKARSATLSGVLVRRAQDDPYAARKQLASLNDELTPQNQATVQSRIDTEIRQREAEARARRAEQRQIQAIARAELRDRVSDATAAYQTGLTYANPPTREDFVAAYGDEADEQYESFRRVQDMQPALQELATASPEEATNILQNFNPAPSGVAGSDFKEKQGIFQSMQRAYQGMVQQREDDPAAYVARYSPTVQQAINTAMTENTPEAYQNLARTSIAEQRRLGVADPKPLTKNQAAGFVRMFDNQEEGGENAAQLVQRESQLYGPYFGDVLKQVGTKLPPEVQVIASDPSPEIAERLASISKIKDSDLFGALETGEKADIEAEVTSQLEPLRQSLVNQAGGLDTYTRLRKVAVKAAASYVVSGDSTGDAAEKVVDGIAGKYTFEDTYRVPNTVDANAVSAGARTYISDLTSDQLYPLEGLPGVSEEDNAKQLEDAVKNSGEWVTNQDESGLDLMVNGYRVLGRDGNPISLTWDQLIQQSQEIQDFQERNAGWTNTGL